MKEYYYRCNPHNNKIIYITDGKKELIKYSSGKVTTFGTSDVRRYTHKLTLYFFFSEFLPITTIDSEYSPEITLFLQELLRDVNNLT